MKFRAASLILIAVSCSLASASGASASGAVADVVTPAAVSREPVAKPRAKVQEASLEAADEPYYLDRNGTTRRHSQDEALARMKLHFTWSQDQCWETDLETDGKAVRNLTRNSNCRPSETIPLFEPSTGRCLIVDAETKGLKFSEEGPLTACKTMKTVILWKTVRNYPNCYEVDAETKGAKYSDSTVPHLACAPDKVSCALESDGWHLRDAEGSSDGSQGGFDSRAAGRQVCGAKGLDPNLLSEALQQLPGMRDSRVRNLPLNPAPGKGVEIPGAAAAMPEVSQPPEAEKGSSPGR